MSMNTFRPLEKPASARSGFALVLTLLALVLLTVLVVGFNAATRTEQMAARNFSYQGVASQMADLAESRALALLNRTVIGGAITQPGRAWSPDAGSVELYSSASSTNRTNANLNQRMVEGEGTSARTNYFISTNTNGAYFSVPLVDVRVSNALVGAFGFWIDDDGSKVNLNSAWTDARTNFIATNARPYSLAVFQNIPGFRLDYLANFGPLITNTNASSRATQGWSYFFTPRQLMMLSNFNIGSYQNLMFQTAGGPENQVRGSFALAPGGQPGALDAGGAAGLLSSPSVGGNANYTRRAGSLLQALDGVAGRYFGGDQYAKYFGSGNDLRAKYGTNITRQIIANINDAVLPATATSFTGADSVDMLAGPNTTGPNNPVPRAVLGVRPSPYLNEVAVAVAQSTNSPAAGAELQIWMQCELVDPYRTGQGGGYEIKYKIGTLRFTGTFERNGQLSSFANPSSSINWNWDGGARSVTLTEGVGSGGYAVPDRGFVFEWQAGGDIPEGASNVVFTRVEVEPVLTLLRRTPGNPTSVRDWAISNDFPVGYFVFNNPPAVSTAFGFNGYGDAAPPAGVQFQLAIAKNDPRVRRYLNYDPPLPAWQPAAATLGAANSTFNPTNGTGISGLGNDLAPGATSIYNHPSFPNSAAGVDRIVPQWVSAFDLGKVHTGLQWRTIQLRAQDPAERSAGHAPDWALLEAFSVSATALSVPAKLNVNSLVYPAATSLSAAELLNAGMARPLAVASLLSGNTNAAAATNASINGVNLGLPSGAVFGATGSDSFLAVASNVARLSFSPAWGGERPTNLPPNALGMVAEVLEINGVSNVGPDEGTREGRARGFYDAVAVSSDVFTIYTAGYALDKSTNVTAETFRRTQVARDPANPAAFRVIFSEPLVWP